MVSLARAAIDTVLALVLWWAALWILHWTTPLTGVFLLSSALLAVIIVGLLGLAVLTVWERRPRKQEPTSIP